ncbi:MAG: hypothetical protein F4Y53_05795 [Proteobacteria bacterium]|nr:hypothetical protein [Pseudomonadota bacterium]
MLVIWSVTGVPEGNGIVDESVTVLVNSALTEDFCACGNPVCWEGGFAGTEPDPGWAPVS